MKRTSNQPNRDSIFPSTENVDIALKSAPYLIISSELIGLNNSPKRRFLYIIHRVYPDDIYPEFVGLYDNHSEALAAAETAGLPIVDRAEDLG